MPGNYAHASSAFSPPSHDSVSFRETRVWGSNNALRQQHSRKSLSLPRLSHSTDLQSCARIIWLLICIFIYAFCEFCFHSGAPHTTPDTKRRSSQSNEIDMESVKRKQELAPLRGLSRRLRQNSTSPRALTHRYNAVVTGESRVDLTFSSPAKVLRLFSPSCEGSYGLRNFNGEANSLGRSGKPEKGDGKSFETRSYLRGPLGRETHSASGCPVTRFYPGVFHVQDYCFQPFYRFSGRRVTYDTTASMVVTLGYEDQPDFGVEDSSCLNRYPSRINGAQIALGSVAKSLPEIEGHARNLFAFIPDISKRRHYGLSRRITRFAAQAGILSCFITAATAASAFPIHAGVDRRDHTQPDGSINPPMQSLHALDGTELLFLYFALSLVAAGLVYLQGSNSHLKHCFLVCGGVLIFICVSMGTEYMLRILPWTLMVTLIASGICHMMTKKASTSVRQHEQGGSTISFPITAAGEKQPVSLVDIVAV